MTSNSNSTCARTTIYIRDLERQEQQLYQQVVKKVKTLMEHSRKKEELDIKKDQEEPLLAEQRNQDQEMLEEEDGNNQDMLDIFDPERDYSGEDQDQDQDQEMHEDPNDDQEVLEALYADLEDIIGENIDDVDIQIAECHRDLLLLENDIIDHRSKIPSGSIMVSTLRRSVDNLITLAQVVYGIMQDEVTEEPFCKNLNELHEKIGFLRKDTEICDWHNDSESWFIYDTLEWLKKVAIRKIEKFVMPYVTKFYESVLTDCSTLENISVFSNFYKFIKLNQSELTEKVMSEYVKFNSNIYTAHVKMLIDEIENMCESKNICGPKGLYMATDTVYFDREYMVRYFSIALRTKPLIELTIADSIDDESSHLECLFKNFHIRLVDLILKENAVLQNVFLLNNEERFVVINQMMKKNLIFLPHFWKKCIDPIDDPITPFLCYLLAYQYDALSRTNEIQNLNKYWKIVGKVMLCRLSSVIFLNIDSLISYEAKKYQFDFCPHYAITRYSVYTAELIRIQKSFPNEFIARLLTILRKTVYEFCFRVAKSVHGSMYQLIFVINCFQNIIDITSDALEGGTEGLKVFADQMPALGARYVHAILNTFYGDMLEYVDEVEQYVATGNHVKLAEYAPIAEKIIENFNVNWKGALDDLFINAELPFMSPMTGAGILEITIKEYHRMLTRFTKAMSNSSKWGRENLVAVLVELEKCQKKRAARIKELK